MDHWTLRVQSNVTDRLQTESGGRAEKRANVVSREDCPIDTKSKNASRVQLLRPVVAGCQEVAARLQDSSDLGEEPFAGKAMLNDRHRRDRVESRLSKRCLEEV